MLHIDLLLIYDRFYYCYYLYFNTDLASGQFNTVE